MASRISPLRGFRTWRSPLSNRSISTRIPLRAEDSATTRLVGDMRSNADRVRPNNSTLRRDATQAEIQNRGTLDLLSRFDRQQHAPRSRLSAVVQGGVDHGRLLEMAKTVKRVWKPGDIYAPHDLTSAEVRKWSKRQGPSADAFDRLAINPETEWKNPAMMFQFQTTMGRIKTRAQTGLRPVNQRRIARAIRRGIGMGFLPSTYAHPEMLRRTPKTLAFN